MAIDENDGQLKAKWGYKRSGDLNDEWVIEDKGNEDPSIDPFTKKEMDKKEKVAKQEKRELKNKKNAQKNQGPKLPSTIAINSESGVKKKKSDIDNALSLARKSTISMGKYDPLLPHEKKAKEKRKFDPLMNELEKTKNMKVLDRILGPQEGRLDANKAANSAIREQQNQKRKTNIEDAGQKKRRKK